MTRLVKPLLFCLLLGSSLPAAESAVGQQERAPLTLQKSQRIALVGNSLAERMNLFGAFETRLHRRFPEQELVVRNFGWPADEVGQQQRPSNYTKLDDPLQVFGPDLFLCFFGFNESFAGPEPAALKSFQETYRKWIAEHVAAFTRDGQPPRFVLVSPIAMEPSGDALLPDALARNKVLSRYRNAIEEIARSDGHHFVDLFTATEKEFAAEPGLQYTVNSAHVNQAGDALVARILEAELFGTADSSSDATPHAEKLREIVNDKSWLHLQDYRMLNGWYVYGGRRTWDTETFPTEYDKIRKMVSVRDRYIWDLVQGKTVPPQPDDSATGEIFIPETMFGSRDEGFRKYREPEELVYPTPEESIAMMSMPEGFEVRLFASEREFPELANPSQINFDNQGRLWAACMATYPQWAPGAGRPNDRLLIFEDDDGDGKADQCKTFYDQLACPTGFEFFNGGVLVVDQPRILFLKDTDGDDRADQVIHLVDGLATDDTHHTMGAWEFSHGGLLHTQEGVSMSTTLETPWGAFRNKGPSGSYVIDPWNWKVRHFRTPAYGNPWCLVFDEWGNAVIGDGTNANQHWGSPLSGAAVSSRRTLQPIFDNEGMRPAVGNDFLLSRHFPDDVQGQFIYGCVINMHGFPRFEVRDEEDGAGLTGRRIADLLSSTDMIFRPVDPKIGPDGALWFGDWCNALIGHMQYSQRDPNRDHEHGRIYRMVYSERDLLEPQTQAGRSIPELLDQLLAYELRTRYRARRELRSRPKEDVLAAVANWIVKSDDPRRLCEAMWIQESFRSVDLSLLEKLLGSPDFHARAAAVHTIGNEHSRLANPLELISKAIEDPHPRVRLEAVRAASFLESIEAAEIALRARLHPVDYWIEYTLEHTLQALQPWWVEADREGTFLSDAPESLQQAFRDYKYSTGPGRAIFKPLKTVANEDASEEERQRALQELVEASGGDPKSGRAVFERVCAACHKHGELGKKFGPDLSELAHRMPRKQIIESIVWPNEEIAKGYETIMVLTDAGEPINGFILDENEQFLTLGVANGKQEVIEKDRIELSREMKASSMPEGLTETIAPIEFLDLLAFLNDGWVPAAAAGNQPLRTSGDFIEVSRDASVKIGKDFPRQWNLRVGTLFTGRQSGRFDFAFHSREGSKTPPAIVVRLAKPAIVREIWMQNRLSSQFHDRAHGLTVWTSADGNEWQQVWQAAKPQKDWTVELPPGPPIQFVKIGLSQPGTLHLNQVVIYGKKPETKAVEPTAEQIPE